MQEFQFDTRGWKEFWDNWSDKIEQIPGLKEDMMKRIGESVQATVQASVDRSGLSDRRGRVKRWQNPHVGSRKGYVATRPDSVEVAAGNKDMQRLNAGALTNFLARGHKARGPSGRSKRYQPRARMTRVRGRDFYEKAKAEAEKIALQEAEDFLRDLAL